MLGRSAITLLLASHLILGQLSNNAVTVTASQTTSATADQAVFALSVQAGVDTSLDTIVGALASVGVTAANLTGFNTSNGITTVSPQSVTALTWTFQLTAPLAKLNQTIAALTALAQTLQQNKSGLSLSFWLTGTQASTTPACNPSMLIPSARTQAQATASAAGLNAGALLAMNTQSGSSACSLTARFALGLLFGPGDQHTITITASRSTSLQPDQALIALTVESGLTSTQDEVAAALAQAGVAGATFSGVNSTAAGAAQPVLEWSYALTAPITSAGATVAQLLAAQQSLAKSNAGLSLTFYVEELQVSQALQSAQTCSQAGLMSDANATAQTLAAAAGVSVGPIISLAAPGTEGSAVEGFAYLTTGAPFTTFLLGPPATNNCSLTVEYQMLP